MEINRKEYIKEYRINNKEKIKEWSKEYREKNQEKIKEWSKEYREKNKDKISIKAKEWYEDNKDKVKENYQKNKEKIKESFLKNKYGITTKEYNKILKKQGGVCAICRNKPNGKNLSVDHNHDTGKVRGLLCHYCNSTLGHSKENILILQKCIEYLKKKT